MAMPIEDIPEDRIAGPHYIFEADVAGLHPHVPIHEVIYGINISLRQNYIYVETPKCACTSIKLALQRLELRNENFNRTKIDDIHNRDISPLLNPRQVGSFRHFLNDKSIFRFCFVRNPYTRLISAYCDKILGNQIQKRDILRILGRNEEHLLTLVSFNEFIDAIASMKIEEMDPHWRPQYYQTLQSAVHYDFIGRFERFNDDIKYVASKICDGLEQFFIIPHLHITNSDLVFDYYIDAQFRKVIREKYEIDFEYFKYER